MAQRNASAKLYDIIDQLSDPDHLNGAVHFLCKAIEDALADGVEFEHLIPLVNVVLYAFLRFGDINEAAGRHPNRDEIKAQILGYWPKRELSSIEERTLTVAIAYREGVRLSASGPNDSPIECAMLAAAMIEGMESDDPVGTVRKSIHRFRRQIRGTKVCRLNPETLMLEIFDAESALIPYLPGKSGRPRRPSNVNRK